VATKAEKAVAKAAEGPKFVEASDVLMALARRAKSKGDSAARARREAAESLASGSPARYGFGCAASAISYEAEAAVWGYAVGDLLDAEEDGFKGRVVELLDAAQDSVEHVAAYLTSSCYGAGGSAEAIAYAGRLDAHTEIRRGFRSILRRAERNGLLDDRNAMSAADRETIDACVAVALMSASSVEK
jgi:hypothetical protein